MLLEGELFFYVVDKFLLCKSFFKTLLGGISEVLEK